MKQRYTLFLVLAFLSAMPLFAQTINYADDGSCYTVATQQMTLLSSDGGSPARNIYKDPTNNFNGNIPIRVIWDSADNRWEIQSDLDNNGSYENLDYSNSFASYPNPPAAGTGTWVRQDPICGPTLTFNGTGTQTTLPVTSIAQTATTEGQLVNLTWETVSETNIDVFVIERQEGSIFKALAEVKATGSAITRQTYHHTLVDQPIGENVYRIVAKGLGGSQEAYRPMRVKVELAEAFALSDAYPNPFNPSTSFTLAVAQTQHVQIKVYDLQGREIATLHNGTLDGQTTHLFRFDAQSMSSGRYLVRVQGE